MEMANHFPEHRRRDRRRKAELAVYQAYADSPLEGLALYGAVPPGGSEVDLPVWYVEYVRMALEIKGGEYEEINGIWQRVPDLGAEDITTQAAQAFDAGMGLHRYLKRHEGDHSPFVVAALVLPDMPAGHKLERTNCQTIIVCGLEDLVERVRNEALARNTIHFPPTWDDARRESKLLMARPSESEPEPQAQVPNGMADLLQDRGIYIERVEHLHLHLGAQAPADIPA